MLIFLCVTVTYWTDPSYYVTLVRVQEGVRVVSYILLTISLFSSLGDSSPVKECAMEDVGGERVALSTLSPRSELFSAGWRVTGQRMSGKRKNNISRYIYIIYISALHNTRAVWIVTGDIDLGDCGGLMLFTGQCSDRNVLQSTWFWS